MKIINGAILPRPEYETMQPGLDFCRRMGVAMNKRLLTVLLSLCAAGFASADEPLVLCKGFLPANDLKIEVGDVNALGVSSATFYAVLDRVEAVYKPIFAAKGAKLKLNKRWDDPAVDASAMKFDATWVVNMYGGLARHQAVTAEGLALVACHEIGHHIGGFPKKSGVWATTEGGADYFATLKCMRLVLTGKEDTSKLDPFAATACKAAFSGEADRKFCEGGALGGMSVATLFGVLRGKPQPSFSTPDTSAVAQTLEEHPAYQCRLDTYLQGSLCAKPVTEDVDKAPADGACTASQGFRVGLRPRCWYKAPAGQEGPRVASRPENAPSEKELEITIEAMRQALSGS